MSFVLALPVFAVVAVLARFYVRTIPAAVGLGMLAGGAIANGLELAVTGAVIDYLAIRIAAGTHAVTNLPDLVAVFSVILIGVCAFRVHFADRRARRAARARAALPA